MFADDTALIIKNKIKEVQDVNSHAANSKTKQYCSQNNLVLNNNKTYQLNFTTTRSLNQYDELPELSTITSVKYLGVIIDNNISWEKRVDELYKKFNSGLHVVRRMELVFMNRLLQLITP